MKNTLETRLGLLVAVWVLLVVAGLELVGGRGRLQSGYQLQALFKNVQDLQEGDSVRMAGVEIGRVEKIRLDQTNNRVLVTLKVRKHVPVRTDSLATIKFTGLMGANFVALDYGTPDSPLAGPATLLSTAELPDLSTLMTKLEQVADGVENVTKAFAGFRPDDLVVPLRKLVEATRGPLSVTLTNLQVISTQIAQGRGTFGKLVYDDRLYVSALATALELQRATVQVRATLAEARKALAQVNAGSGSAGKLLYDESLYAETTAALTGLEQILQKIDQGRGTLGLIVNDDRLYKNARFTLQKLDKASDGLEDQGPLAVLGLIIGAIFKTQNPL